MPTPPAIVSVIKVNDVAGLKSGDELTVNGRSTTITRIKDTNTLELNSGVTASKLDLVRVFVNPETVLNNHGVTIIKQSAIIERFGLDEGVYGPVVDALVNLCDDASKDKDNSTQLMIKNSTQLMIEAVRIGVVDRYPGAQEAKQEFIKVVQGVQDRFAGQAAETALQLQQKPEQQGQAETDQAAKTDQAETAQEQQQPAQPGKNPVTLRDRVHKTSKMLRDPVADPAGGTGRRRAVHVEAAGVRGGRAVDRGGRPKGRVGRAAPRAVHGPDRRHDAGPHPAH